MMPSLCLAGILISAMTFLTCLSSGTWDPCVEVAPNITYDCMEQNLNNIPNSLPSTTENLDLSFNPLKSLGSNYFSNYPKLQVLDLSRCEITKIEDYAFEGLNQLSTLILTANPIQRLALGGFSGLWSLKKLVVVETNMASLENFPIGHLRTLKHLNVAHNLIHSFKLPEYFSNLVNLEYLDLSNNKIQYIYHKDLQILHENPQLNLSLDLSLNPIDFIQLGVFQDIRLHELTLRSNFNSTHAMTSCLHSLLGLEVHRLVLGEYKNERTVERFDSSVLGGLCGVSIDEFRLAHIDQFLWEFTDTLNCLANISAMSMVSLKFEKLKDDDFSNHFKWKSLSFMKCVFKTFPPLALPFLRSLIFIDNKGATSYDDVDLPNLEFLNISGNGLSFKSCCSVKHLGTPRLKYLDLSSNGVVTMSSNFQGLEQLEHLHLQHSTLKKASEFSIFFSLNKLLYLDISDTHIRVDFNGIFHGLISLQVLKMAGNSFKANTLSNIFTNMTNLTFLDLSDCHLEQVTLEAFATLSRLQVLNISHNNLLVLDTLHYKPLQRLQLLDCSYNHIETIKGEELHHFPSSQARLNLTGNDIACTCEYQSFLQWVKDKRQLLVEAEQMKCVKSLHMKGSPVLSFRNSTCEINKGIISISVITVIFVATVVFLVYKFYFHLMLIVGCKKYARGESTYDAFVIYSSHDEDWVRNELVKNLEEGVPPFQLCLHYRDFIPGVAIAANIIHEGFHKSRKVIVVVSQHFIQSRWCIFEYEIAQTWQFLSSRSGIIFIILEKVEKALLRQQVELYRLLSRNTYLEWEDTTLGRHIFWRRLRTALLNGKPWHPEGTVKTEINQQETTTSI